MLSRRGAVAALAGAFLAAGAGYLVLRDARKPPLSNVPTITPLGAQRWQHPGRVWKAKFFPDGKRLATACEDGYLRIWPLAGGEPSSQFPAYPRGMFGYLALAIAPDGQTLTTAGGENLAHVWIPAIGHELFTLGKHAREVAAVAYASDSSTIATAGHDKAVRLWSSSDGVELKRFADLPDPALCVAFSATGLLAAGLMNGAVQIWDTASGKLLNSVGHTKRVWSLAFAGSVPERLVSASHDGSIRSAIHRVLLPWWP